MTAHPLDEKKPERRGRKPERRRDLFLRLAAEIDSGRLTGKLPGVLKLAEQYHSSHGTVQNTLRMLAEAGYLEIQPRSGSYVRRRLEAVMVGLYVENQKVLNLPDAYTNFMANMGPLYQSLHDTLSRAGVPLSFEVAEAGNAEMVRRLKRPDRHLIINFPILEPGRYYSLFDGCAWTRISGTFDPDCPSAHFACDNPAIGRLAARRLRERGCRRFISIGSLAIGLFRQRFDAFAEELRSGGFPAEHIEIDSFRMNLPEMLNRLKSALLPCADSLRSGETGLFCGADAFMQPLQQALDHLPDGGAADTVIVSCDNNPYFLQNVMLEADEIDIGLRAIGEAVGNHILTEPDRPVRQVFPPILRESARRS